MMIYAQCHTEFIVICKPGTTAYRELNKMNSLIC